MRYSQSLPSNSFSSKNVPHLTEKRYRMTRKTYPSDLSDRQWQLLEPLIPPEKPRGKRRSVDLREIVNGIFYLLHTGCTLAIATSRSSALADCIDILLSLAASGGLGTAQR